jgi:O-antigen/teichoic acid export membrane protein
MKFLRDVGTTLIARFSALVFVLVASILIARGLQPAGKGVYASLRASAELAAAVTALGMGNSLVYFVSRGNLDRRKLLSTAITLYIGAGILATALVLYLVLFVEDTSTTLQGWSPALIAALCFPVVTLFTECFEGYLRGQQKINLLNIGYTSRTVGYVVVLVLALAFDIFSLDVALVGLLLSSFLPTLIYLPALLQDGVTALIPRFDFSTAKSLLSYGFGFQVFASLQKLGYRLDLLLIAYFLNDASVGYYSMSVSTGQLTWHFPTAISFVLLPMLATAAEDRDSVERTALVARSTVILMIGSVIAMGLVAQWLIPLLYGVEYIPAITPLLLLLPGMISGGLSHILNDYLLVQRKQLHLIAISSIGLLINVILNLLIIPTHGINGAAVVSSITATVICVLTVLYITHTSKMSVFDFILINRADVAQVSNASKKLVTSVKMRFGSLRS